MRKQIKKMTTGFLAAAILSTAVFTGGSVFAASTQTAPGILSEAAQSEIGDMLVLAITDEYEANAMYEAVIEKYGEELPFIHIVNAETRHISRLQTLLAQYGVTVPDKDWSSQVSVPASLDEAYQAGIKAEEANIAMYEGFLKSDLPEDVQFVFERMIAVSNRHLQSLQAAAEGELICPGTQNRMGGQPGYGAGRGMGGGYKRGQGGRNGMMQGSYTGNGDIQNCPYL